MRIYCYGTKKEPRVIEREVNGIKFTIKITEVEDAGKDNHEKTDEEK